MPTHPSRARPVLIAAIALLAMLAATVGTAPPAGADHDVTPARLGGADRFATAAEIAAVDHPSGSGVALLANGMRYADALAA